MKNLLFLLLLNFSSNTICLSQGYILDFGFENTSQKKNKRGSDQKYLLEKFDAINSFDWFVIDNQYKNVYAVSHHNFFIISNTKVDKVYKSDLMATPSYEGYGHVNLKDNYSLHTKLSKSIKKNNKYKLEYFLNKSFMANSANKYFYMSLLLSQKEPSIKEDNKIQLVQNQILHSDIKINKYVSYSFEKNKLDTIRIEPRPDLWQKFSIEFVAEDDFEFLGLIRDIKHPQGLTEFMHIDNVQLYLIEDNTDQKEELVNKIDNLAKQIQFETGSSNLTVQSKVVLDSLCFYLKDINQSNYDFLVEINGHTDNEGNEQSNLLLSKQRTETVKTFFQKNKNLHLPILTTGFGNSQPLISNDTEEGKAANRRVEIKIIDKKSAKNIIFESLFFEEALQKAKKENKLIFIDAYTTWCKPCKLMDRDVFTDSTVAKVFNENFINLKIDMESEIGKPLNTKYKINGYPTFLFVDFEGNLKYKKEGFMNVVEFSNFATEVAQLKSEKNTESTTDLLQKRLYEKSKIDYEANPCKLEFVEAYFNLIDKEKKEEIQKVQSDYVQCLENSQDFSSKQVSFLLNSLVQTRNDTTYNFYLRNKPKFEKNYGDSLLVLESYLEEAFFIQKTDSIIKQIGEREKLTQQEIEEFEKNVTYYAEFSQKIEKESKEKGFERPIKSGFVDYLIYTTAIQFYNQHKELDKFSKYLIQYNQLDKLDSYKRDLFGEINIPLRSFALYTADYLEQEDKKAEVIKELSSIWKGLIGRGYIKSYADHVIAAKVFYYNKEKEEAQKILQKISKAKKSSFEQKVYEKLEAQINQL